MKSDIKQSARERLLAAASELFYAEGVQTVGIDRVIEHAGVAKASLYNTFGSKENLVQAYLVSRHEATLERLRCSVDVTAIPGSGCSRCSTPKPRCSPSRVFTGAPSSRPAPKRPTAG